MKQSLPEKIRKQLERVIELRNARTHSALDTSNERVGEDLLMLIDSLTQIANEKSKLHDQVPSPKKGRLSIVEIVRPPMHNAEPSSGYVLLHNDSNVSHNMEGFRIEIWDFNSANRLKCHVFKKLKGSFDSGECMCCLFCFGNDHFSKEREEHHFPVAHWDIYVGEFDTYQLVAIKRLLIRVVDESGVLVDELMIEQSRPHL